MPVMPDTAAASAELANWQVYWQVTVAPQKDINIRLPVGGPFFWGSFSLFLVLPLFVLVGAVGIVSVDRRSCNGSQQNCGADGGGSALIVMGAPGKGRARRGAQAEVRNVTDVSLGTITWH